MNSNQMNHKIRCTQRIDDLHSNYLNLCDQIDFFN